MTAYTIDNKRRVTLKDASPGDVVDVEYIGGGHWRIAKLRREPEPQTEETTETAED